MNIEKIVKFIQKETPENENLLLVVYKSIHDMLSTEQKIIDHRIPELIEERDYDRVNKYVEMSKIVSEIYLDISEYAKEYGLDKSDIVGGDMIGDDDLSNELFEDEIETPFTSDKRINYEDYRVDESIAYGLMTDFRYMKPAAFSLDGVRYPARLWKLVLLKTCELLWSKNQIVFEDFINDKFMQGKTRDYFSMDNSGMTKPELLEGTNIFVETNLSANNIRDVIVKMLDKYRIPHAAYQIYLSKDLNPLHSEENMIATSKAEDNICGEAETDKHLLQDTESLNMEEYCEDYDYKTGKCMNEKSPYFIMECCKQKKCTWIKRKAINDETGNIYVLPKSILKKKKCPQCRSKMEGTLFPIEFIVEQEVKQRILHGCWCSKCSKAYVTEGTYYSFVKNKKLENIKAKFVISDDNEQLSLF